MSIADSLARLEEEIRSACREAGRDRDEITLVAVSKTYPASAVREAYQAGVRRVGENRVQEILAKRRELLDLDLAWHMIGTLQTNKVKAVVPEIEMIHSLDRIELAQAISRHLGIGVPLPALIQVNTTQEQSKSGISPEGLETLVDQVRSVPGLELAGLMTIGPLIGDDSEVRAAFALLRTLRDRLVSRNPELRLPHLSMGMSEDFRSAILEGATILRIGSRIFGPRTW
jgi:PLP dependent protein